MKTYLPTRLQQQAWFINAFLEQNQGYNDQYLMLVHTQIPISRKGWLTNLDFTEINNKLKLECPTRTDITNLRDFLKRPLARKDA